MSEPPPAYSTISNGLENRYQQDMLKKEITKLKKEVTMLNRSSPKWILTRFTLIIVVLFIYGILIGRFTETHVLIPILSSIATMLMVNVVIDRENFQC